MPRRTRASKARIQVTLQDVLFLRGRPRDDLVRHYGSEAMALAYWKVWREQMLARGVEERPLPWRWTE
jgi:hypothetical protein